MQHLPVYCKGCGVAVAPYAPDRVQKDLDIWHQACLRKKQAKDEEAKQKLAKQTAYAA